MMGSLRFCWWFHIGILLISVYFYRKVRHVADVQKFLGDVSKPMRDDAYFRDYNEQLSEALENIQSKGPPAILLLNKFALNITLNFICNLRQFDGAAERLLIIVFDDFSHDVIVRSFPELSVIRWKLSALEDKFSAGQGRYQVFQYFRARFSAHLTEKTDSFWMVQADTVWRENLFEFLDLEENGEFRRADIIFDKEGDEGLLSQMVAGGYFFVRSSSRTKEFFETIADFLLDYFSTDNNVMTRQCARRDFGVKCAFIPYRTLANWRSQSNSFPSPPPFFQLDGGESPDDKFAKMRDHDALFVDPDALNNNSLEGDNNKLPVWCLPRPIKNNKSPAGDAEEVDSQQEGDEKDHQKIRIVAKGSAAVKVSALVRGLHTIFEWLAEWFPRVKIYILTEVFPYYAYYFFV